MKDISISLKFWGMAKIYKYGTAVAATEWHGVSEAKKQKIANRISSLATKVNKKIGRAKPGLTTKILFCIFRLFHKKWRICEADIRYWQEKGWLDKNRPWKI